MNEKYNRLQKLNHAHLKPDSKKPRLVAMFDLWNTLAGFTVTHEMLTFFKQEPQNSSNIVMYKIATIKPYSKWEWYMIDEKFALSRCESRKDAQQKPLAMAKSVNGR